MDWCNYSHSFKSLWMEQTWLTYPYSSTGFIGLPMLEYPMIIFHEWWLHVPLFLTHKNSFRLFIRTRSALFNMNYPNIMPFIADICLQSCGWWQLLPLVNCVEDNHKSAEYRIAELLIRLGVVEQPKVPSLIQVLLHRLRLLLGSSLDIGFIEL